MPDGIGVRPRRPSDLTYWHSMTLEAYFALPSRLEVASFVVGQVYRDPENPTCVFRYNGASEEWHSRVHGREALPDWSCATFYVVP